MKKYFAIYCRELEIIAMTSRTETIYKFYKIGVKNRFETYQEISWFLQNPENSKYFMENIEYLIMESYEKVEVPQEEQLKQGF